MTGLLAVLFVAVMAAIVPKPRCGDRRWMPYEDETGFGYAEWTCSLAPSHEGQHEGWRW